MTIGEAINGLGPEEIGHNEADMQLVRIIVAGLAGLDQEVIDRVLLTSLLQAIRFPHELEHAVMGLQEFRVNLFSAHHLMARRMLNIEGTISELTAINSVSIWKSLMTEASAGEQVDQRKIQRAAEALASGNRKLYSRAVILLGLAVALGGHFPQIVTDAEVRQEKITQVALEVSSERTGTYGSTAFLAALQELYQEEENPVFTLLCRSGAFRIRGSCPGVELTHKMLLAYRAALARLEYRPRFTKAVSYLTF